MNAFSKLASSSIVAFAINNKRAFNPSLSTITGTSINSIPRNNTGDSTKTSRTTTATFNPNPSFATSGTKIFRVVSIRAATRARNRAPSSSAPSQPSFTHLVNSNAAMTSHPHKTIPSPPIASIDACFAFAPVMISSKSTFVVVVSPSDTAPVLVPPSPTPSSSSSVSYNDPTPSSSRVFSSPCRAQSRRTSARVTPTYRMCVSPTRTQRRAK